VWIAADTTAFCDNRSILNLRKNRRFVLSLSRLPYILYDYE